MTIPTEVAAVLADLKNSLDGSPALTHWHGRFESALTAKAEAVEPVAWLVTREGDPTFPKAYIREDYADLWNERNDLPPFIEKTPLYAHAPPAAPVESPCTCPSGDGSLRWPCPKHPSTESIGRAPDGLCPQCNGEREGYLIDGDGPYLCNACEDAPPAVPVASVPDGWREDVSLAAQMLTWGREEGLDSKQIDAIDAHAEKLFAMLSTPPTNQEGTAP